MRGPVPILLFLLIGSSHGVAQIRVDRPIEFNSVDPEKRQLQGVPSQISPDAVLNADIELSGQHRIAQPASGSLWQIDLASVDQAPSAGMHIIVKAPLPVNGPLQVMINEHGPFPIVHGPNTNVDAASVPDGTMLSLVYDGTAFQLMNGVGRSPLECPSGMIPVNDQFCISSAKFSEQLEFWDAIESCGAIGQRLCSWGEYYSACSNAAMLGIMDMPSGWEWTNQTANEDGSVRIAGNSNCTNATTSPPIGDPMFYRCCFTR